MFKKLIILTLLVVLSLYKVVAQDAAFSQYYSSELYLNPALAGEERDMVFTSNYRQQWRSIVIPYVTNQLSAVYPVYKKGMTEKHLGGVGLSLYNDRAGDGNFKTLGVNLNLAYNMELSRDGLHDISFGLQGGMIQKNVDYTNLEWGEQFNPFIGFDAAHVPAEAQFTNGTFYPDISAGIMYYFNAAHDFTTNKILAYGGLSAYHINQPNESFVNGLVSKLPLLLKLHGGVDYALNTKVHLSPSFLLMRQNDVNHLNGGLYVTYRLFQSPKGLLAKTDLIAGTWYRLKDSFIFSLGLHSRAYTLGFSYDYNSSSLRFATRGRGAYEVSLAIRRIKNHSLKRIATPRI